MAKIQPVEDQKWFHRDYEKTFGHLSASQLPPIDWSIKEHLEALFPFYKREQLDAERKKIKPSKVIEVENFSLWTPTKDRQLFKNASLTLEPNKRCAVYGTNGSGKTMLFHNIATGELLGFPTTVSVHHMQEMSMDPEADKVSVMETIISSHPMRRVLVVMEDVLTKLVKEESKTGDDMDDEAALAQALAATKVKADEEDVVDSSKLGGYKRNLNMVKLMMTTLDGYTAEERTSRMLKVLGFDKKGEESLMSSLSGGLRMRVALASAFFINPDLLLLDEPTNHLDLPSVLWLENNLRGYKGSFLVVTHDRHLLENVVSSVLFLEDQTIVPFKSSFSDFEKERAKLAKIKEKKIDQFMARNRNLDTCSPLYRQKLQYQEWQQAQYHRGVAMQGKFTFKAPKALPNPTAIPESQISLIKINNVRFSYDVAAGLPYIFDAPISYEITMGTRVGVMGPNGAGKSTLLKLITQHIVPTEGNITRNKDFVTAYFGQHSTKELLMTETPVEFMVRMFPKAKAGELKTHLAKTSVDAGTMEKRMAGLSFSQRSCVIFAKLTFVPPHLLILDEPTNFLDLESVDSLIRAVKKFSEAGGALITVTHNRDFLKRCSKKFLSITPGAFLEYDTMKEAERATYSFIEALESGKAVDHKAAIQANRGGGAIHTEEYLKEKEDQRTKLDTTKLAEQALEDAAKKLEEEKQAAHAAKLGARAAAQKMDWEKDDKAWAPITTGNKTVWMQCTVIRHIPTIGVTIELPDKKTALVQAKKLKLENPEARSGGGGGAAGGRGGGRGGGAPRGGGKGGKGAAGGKGGKGAAGGKGAKGGKGGKGGRGGANGGRGGRGGY